jgi:predicted  nucleic acid-binding Zn-ribbon protein
LEEIELEVMQRLDDAEKSLLELREERETQRAEIVIAEQSTQSRLTQIAGERSDLLRNRSALIMELPADLIELYERQRSRYGIGAALLTRGVSGGSGLALSETDLAKIREADDDDVILCPDSNCILIRTPESGL